MNNFRKILTIVLLWQLMLSTGALNSPAQQPTQPNRQSPQLRAPSRPQSQSERSQPTQQNSSDDWQDDQQNDQQDNYPRQSPAQNDQNDQTDQSEPLRDREQPARATEPQVEPSDPATENTPPVRRRRNRSDNGVETVPDRIGGRQTTPNNADNIENSPQNSPPLEPQGNNQNRKGQDLADGGTLKIGVELVQVVFSVVDERNRLVADLKPKDLQLLDNGQPQELELFQRSNNLPMMLSILIDMSGSQEFLLPDEKTSVNTFFDSFFREGRDYGSILTFQGETSLGIGLTSNLGRLKTALQRIKREETFRDEEGGAPNLGTALYDAIDITSREVLDGKTARRITNQDASKTQSRRAAIRRAICVLTDGVDTASQLNLQQAIRAAQRRGIAVYALGLGDRFRYGNVNQQGLDQLCLETGGRAFYPKSESELRQAFQQVSNELSSQYILAYYPTSGDSNSNFREIEIKIPGQPGWRVIHRRGYLTEKP